MDGLPPLAALAAFRAVMAAGSFVGAARDLGLTPSAVSHRIRTLEDHLGLPLFERRNRAAIPTEAARTYAAALAEGFARMAAATRRLREEGRVTRLAVHAAPSFAARVLMPRLSGFIERHPDVAVTLSSTPDAVGLDDGRFDVDVQYGRPVPEGSVAVDLPGERVVPMAAPSFLARWHVETPEDLARVPLIRSVRCLVPWEAWFAARGLAIRPDARAMAFDRSYLALAAARDGLGLALESTLLARDALANGELALPFGLDGPEIVGHRIVVPRDLADAPKVRAFTAWLVASLAP